MLYIYLGMFLVMMMLLAYAKLKGYQAEKYQAQKETALNTAISEGKIIMQKTRTDGAVKDIQIEQQTEQRIEQQKLDSGDRSGLDKDTF